MIVWGKLPPGTRLSERLVATRLGVGRTPIRHALHRLQQEGLVIAPRGGSEQRLVVAPMTQEDGEELYLMVGHLEGLAARNAARLPAARRKEIAARMRAVNRKLAAALRARHAQHLGFADVRLVFDLDLELHSLFVEGIVGPRVLALHRAIKPQIERYARAYIGVLLGPLVSSVAEHEIIADAIAKGDLLGAQLAVETNWHNAAERLMRVIAHYGERGSWGVVELSNGVRDSRQSR
jgi:DNA-binding GntR family transcriptional regulator